MPTVLHTENPRRAYLPAKDFNGPLNRVLRQSLRFHRAHHTQENLVMLGNLALHGLPRQEKLAGMSIHNEIKRRREALGWSHQTLANRVSAAENLKKALAWQTVQQWENGASAPKRTRMPYVAEALGCSLVQLMSEEAETQAMKIPTVASKPGRTGSAPSKYVPSGPIAGRKQAKKGAA